MLKQFTNNDCRVFKETYSPNKLIERLWDSLEYYRQLQRSANTIDTSLDFGLKYVIKEENKLWYYRKKLIKNQINKFREENGLPRIPRSSIKWHYKSEVIKDIKEYKYGYVG